MNPQESQDPLAQLQDIHVPNAIGLWPPAWGWWLLLVAVIAIVAAAIFFIRRYQLRNGYRRLALHELHAIQQRYTAEQTSEYLQAISILLRRTALSGFGSGFDASLKGSAWLQWLDQQVIKPAYRFDSDVGRVLLVGPYQKQPAVDRDQLQAIVAAWIEQHRNQWQQKNSKPVAQASETNSDQTEARQDV